MVNAIADRDYSISGTQIDVDIYSDRIEIVSPGSWLLPKDYNAYPAGSIPSIRRNAIIAACQGRYIGMASQNHQQHLLKSKDKI